LKGDFISMLAFSLV